jgi:iron complex transport system ATP-binding protein
VAAVTDSRAKPVLECAALTVRVPGRELVSALDAPFRPGTVTAVLGCNGAGKSSLLHVLAGLAAPAGGEVRLGGQALGAWLARDLARNVGLLLQASEDPFPATALETALVGRHPHLDFWQWETETDRAVARECLAAMDLAGLEARDVTTLSGGERRRLAIATVLAQDPQVFLLDEPIQQLDPQHQLRVLRRFRALADAGRTVVLSLHDPGLAARFADAALLLSGDGRWQHGPVHDALNEASIGALYGIPVRELRWPDGRTFVPACPRSARTRDHRDVELAGRGRVRRLPGPRIREHDAGPARRSHFVAKDLHPRRTDDAAGSIGLLEGRLTECAQRRPRRSNLGPPVAGGGIGRESHDDPRARRYRQGCTGVRLGEHDLDAGRAVAAAGDERDGEQHWHQPAKIL